MKRVFTLLLLLPAFAMSQYTVTVIIDAVPKNTGDKVYVAGNWNNFAPDDPNSVLLKNTAGKFSITFHEVDAMDYEFRFTLGSLGTIEVDAKGADIPNRKVTVKSDTTFHFTVVRWKGTQSAAGDSYSALYLAPAPKGQLMRQDD